MSRPVFGWIIFKSPFSCTSVLVFYLPEHQTRHEVNYVSCINRGFIHNYPSLYFSVSADCSFAAKSLATAAGNQSSHQHHFIFHPLVCSNSQPFKSPAIITHVLSIYFLYICKAAAGGVSPCRRDALVLLLRSIYTSLCKNEHVYPMLRQNCPARLCDQQLTLSVAHGVPSNINLTTRP